MSLVEVHGCGCPCHGDSSVRHIQPCCSGDEFGEDSWVMQAIKRAEREREALKAGTWPDMKTTDLGRFIAIEGPDGVGKTTQVGLLTAALNERKIPTVAFREPGGTEAGEVLRDLVKSPTVPLTPKAQLCCILAARAQLAEEKIIPLLSQGVWVVTDRYYPSTIAYRPDLPRDMIMSMMDAIDPPQPDMYIFLTATPEQVAKRIHGRAADRFDNDGENEQRMQLYRDLAKEFNGKEVSTDCDPDETLRRILKLVIWKLL
jgi:dTMP kinase